VGATTGLFNQTRKRLASLGGHGAWRRKTRSVD